MSNPRVLVAQIGARRHYAVPVALHRRGLLEHLFTDLYLPDGAFSRMVRFLGGRGPRWLTRVAGRYEPALPPELVTSFPAFGLQYKIRVRGARCSAGKTRAWIWGGQRFCELIVSRGLGRATVVYGYSSAVLELFQHAHAAGIRCVLDHATAPRKYEDALVRAECDRFPGWWTPPPADPAVDQYDERQRQEWRWSDRIVCGSSFVRRAIEEEGGPIKKTVVVPLGLDRGFTPRAPQFRGQRALRVLFVGDDGLRKGLGDLAAAAALLGSKYVEVRAVGDLRPTETGRRCLERHIALVGPVPRLQMAEQYRWADVVVLPSVSDTFALVILEAMSAGVPVITTPNTGGPDVIRDGVDGFIVPIRSPEAIAEKLEELATRDDLLSEISMSAVVRARDFSGENYAAALAEAVSEREQFGTVVN